MAQFQSAVMYLNEMGVSDVILPFVLIFTVLYAILQQVQLFGKEGKRYNVVISLAIALTMVILHKTNYYKGALGWDPIDFLNNVLPGSALIILIVMTILIVFAVFMPGKLTIEGSPVIAILGFLSVVGLGGIILYNLFPEMLPYSWLDWLNDSATQSVVIMILVFVAIIWFVTAKPSEDKNVSGMKSFHNFVKGMAGFEAAKEQEKKG